MSPGTHAAEDGSFSRSAGIQAGRAAVLIGVAFIIGFLLLHRVPGGVSDSVGAGSGSQASLPTLPTLPSQSGGRAPASTVSLPASGSATTSTTKAPKDVKVLVANGTTTAGLASQVTESLRTKGYTTLTPTDTSAHVTTSMVYFEPGYGSDAAALATKLGLAASAVSAMPTPSPVPALGTANVLVVAGPNLNTAAGTTSTT